MRRDVHRVGDLAVDAILCTEVEIPLDTGELRDQGDVCTGDEFGAAIRVLDDADEVAVQQLLLGGIWERGDEILTGDDAVKRVGGEDLVHAGQAETDAADDNRFDLRGCGCGRDGLLHQRCRSCDMGHLIHPLDEPGEGGGIGIS